MEIFNFKNYRDFLLDFLEKQPNKGHGVRSRWAKAMGCQVAFVSHVLNGLYELSLEQAERLSEYLALNIEEKEFFLLLVQHQRAGTSSLKSFYLKLIQEKIEVRQTVRNRMKIKENLSIEDQSIYYSNWIYAAVHILLTIPKFQKSAVQIAEYFNEPLAHIREVLEFLVTRKIIANEGGTYKVLNNFIFISKESPLYSHHQIMWRQKAVDSIYKKQKDEIHIATLFSLSESDVAKVKKILLDAVERSTEVIKPSKEEKLYSMNIDYFEVR